MPELLEISGLCTHFFTAAGLARAVDGVDLHLQTGETLALVGESGCGKSVTALSILRLVAPPGRIIAGRIDWKGRDLLALPPARMRAVRGNEISMIFQEPMTSLNPVFTVGEQIAETLRLHRGMNRREAFDGAVRALAEVQISDPRLRAAEYPHQHSGGMRQRAMIAMALCCDPDLLIADEPTTALDVTIQAQILHILQGLQKQRGLAVLLITHDLGIVARLAARVAVMYSGRIVEQGTVGEIYRDPLHPYTRGLLRSLPRAAARGDAKRRRLPAIAGNVPDLLQLPPGCSFEPRCPERLPRCREVVPGVTRNGAGREVRCFLHGEGVED